MRMRGRERKNGPEAVAKLDNWMPKTDLGRRVQAGEITSLEQITSKGLKILEPEIIGILIQDLNAEVLEVKSVQRMTAYGRKQKMRAIAIVGNSVDYIGAGTGKAVDSRDAINEAIKSAKKNIVKVELGCGSWECGCGTKHTLGRESKGHSSSTEITLKPAPRGVGIVANETAKKVLKLAGVKDVWTFTKGRTRNILNMTLATIAALNNGNTLKKGNTVQE